MSKYGYGLSKAALDANRKLWNGRAAQLRASYVRDNVCPTDGHCRNCGSETRAYCSAECLDPRDSHG